MGSNNFIKEDFSNRGWLPNLAKYYLLIINILFSALGGFSCGYGIVSLITYLTSPGLTSIVPHILAIVSGILLILLANLALQGTYKENILMLKIYAGILLFFVVLRIIIIILGAVMSKREIPNMVSGFKEQFDLYGTDKTATEVVDLIQKSLHCCGFDGPESMKFGNGSYPQSCCSLRIECHTPHILKCSTELQKSFLPATLYVVGFYTLFAIEVLTAVATFYFISFLKKQSALKRMALYNNF